MSRGTSSVPNRPERILGSFASLLSSAKASAGDVPTSTSSENLPKLVASTVSDDTDCCTVPCLMLKHRGSSESNSQSSLEDTAALYLARPLTLTRTELEAVPMALLDNVSESFMSLVDSRLRSSLVALMKHPEVLNENSITRAVVAILTASSEAESSPIVPTAIVTSFRVLPVSDRTQNGDLVAPLVMETVIDLSIFNQLVTITFVAPGTIQGTFDSSTISDCLPTKLVVVLDTVALLKAMMEEARSVVRESVTIASGVASNLLLSHPQDAESSTAGEQGEEAQQGSRNSNDQAKTVDKGRGEGMDMSNMEPPPPRLPRSSGSTPDLPSEDGHPDAGAETKRSNDSGLSLLTAAAMGLKQGPAHKKRRMENSSSSRCTVL